MALPILATKLHIPRPRPEVVQRTRLIAQLNEGLHRKLTLISAPAGFGKTTLVSQWIDEYEQSIAWLSLDERDSDLTRFLTYVVATMQTIAAPFGERILDDLQSPQPPPAESMLTALLNEIAAIPDDFLLVLDDYHLIDATSVDDALGFLLEYLPPQMHLVITTREDPQLPLSRLRARGQLTEIRAADLRFTADEAATFFSQVMGLDLSSDEVAALESRTEGWIAGLQLAALSMQGHDDVHGFVTAFAGDNRYIVDYLVEEVLQRQPEVVRGFLLQTSILNRLNESLCNAVTDGGDSNGLLESLERSNLFVIPLDDRRQWYRYHHLFADVLYAHLIEEQPDHVTALHLRASAWFEDDGSLADAIRHALAAEDLQRVAKLVELAWSPMDRSRQFATWLVWVKTIPDELIRIRPVLNTGYAWALLESGALEAGESRLRDVEKLLETPSAEMIVDDEVEFQSVPASIANARTYLALAHGDMSATAQYARQALELLPENDHLRRGIPASLLGLACWVRGDLEAAQQSLAEALTSFEMSGNILFALTGVYVMADIQLAAGQLRKAINTYERYLQLAEAQGQPPIRGMADLHLGISDLFREQGDVQSAAQHLLKSEELSERAAFPRWEYRWCLVQARIRQSLGDLDGALAMLDDAEPLFIRGPVPDMRPVGALRAGVWIAQGKLAEAQKWVLEQGLSAGDELSYVREFEYLTLARLLIAQQQVHEAIALIARLLEAADSDGRTGNTIEILTIKALAHEAQGDVPTALDSLKHALTLAEPEGYVRVFVDEGPPMKRLLSEAAHQEIMPDYVGKLLATFDVDAGEVRSSAQPLIEPLSDRELEVLRLIADGLSNREIGKRLYLALDTVKGHNRRIYAKLGVQRRTEAVACARELGLL